jgi:hypothetical protein
MLQGLSSSTEVRKMAQLLETEDKHFQGGFQKKFKIGTRKIRV